MHRLSDHATVPNMRRTLLLLSTAFALTAAASAAELRLGIAVEPDSIDPHYHNFGGNKGLVPNVFDALTSIDPHDHLIPSLALSWR
jgi:peptide/nickel transport system substrate-binding protein